MAESTSAEPSVASRNDPETARAIRFAVYLTGGLVLLAFGVEELSSALGIVLNCLLQAEGFCPNGFTQSLYIEYLPILGGGTVLVVTAIVLLLLARRSR